MFFFTAKGRNKLSKSETEVVATFTGFGSDVDGLAVGFESHVLNMVALLPVVHAPAFFVLSTFVVFPFSPSVASCSATSSQRNLRQANALTFPIAVSLFLDRAVFCFSEVPGAC